jgi:hypothetical protein|nr:MAG TPA: hypothetical protein [Caudoviricetes sp.]
MPEENTWYIKLVKPNHEAQCIENRNLINFMIDLVTFMRTYYSWEDSLTIVDYDDYKTELMAKRAIFETLKKMFTKHIVLSNGNGIYSKLSEDYILTFLSPSDK